MRYRVLLLALSMFFGMMLTYYVSLLAFNIYMNTIWKPSEECYESSRIRQQVRKLARIHREDGFEIPVYLNMMYPDTTIQMAGKLNEHTRAFRYKLGEIGKFHWYNGWRVCAEKWAENTASIFDTIYAVDTLIIRAIVAKPNIDTLYSRGDQLESRFRRNQLEYNKLVYAGPQTHMKASINIKPKTSGQYILLFSRTYLRVLFCIFIFYQLFRASLMLKSDLSITENLCRRIKIMGWGIVSYSVLAFQIDYMISSLYRLISIQSNSTAINHIDSLNINMSPYYSFNFESLSLGLSLIVLSILAKRSLEIEKSWSLTI